ncbi:TPA: ABC transporter ATP-binding protein [Klebsiella variicola]|uniref:ABC transporter ATP-binding protein n=1 Tax=Klebsiella variicola TaxID=244366 RepID=UPI0029467BFB|nr:ABC transporter ATP-binding protein [Klebsiella variicola subsp. variicola]HED4010396.1 ABC transporter ATP-binding protein [Klebsiella variicola subsp. variicola]
MISDLLTVCGLHLRNQQPGSEHLVSDISFSLAAGATLGIVGESGSGKSLTLRALTGYLPRGIKITTGDIWINGVQYLQDGITKKNNRSHAIGMVFQNPMSALNPLMQIGKLLSEIHRIHTRDSREKAKARAIELIEMVGIAFPEKAYYFYPHQFSGGQRQRIILAVALAKNPRILLCDEPTTALDTVTQTQIVMLIKSLCRKKNIAVIFVSHDLSVVSQLCDNIYVMKDGLMVESGNTEDVLNNPRHAYTRKLINSQLLLEGNNR